MELLQFTKFLVLNFPLCLRLSRVESAGNPCCSLVLPLGLTGTGHDPLGPAWRCWGTTEAGATQVDAKAAFCSQQSPQIGTQSSGALSDCPAAAVKCLLQSHIRALKNHNALVNFLL